MFKQQSTTKAMLPLNNAEVKRNWTTVSAKESISGLEQEAMTAPAVEKLWLLIMMGLVMLVLSIYWLTEQHIEEPAWVYHTPTSAAVTVTVPTPFATHAAVLISADPEPVIVMSEVESSSPVEPLVAEQDILLVKRFYDEVLGRQNYTAMAELFAPDITYRDGEQATTSLTLETLTRLIRAERSSYDGLLYTAEKVIVDGNWIWVHWSAQRWPLDEDPYLPPADQSPIWTGSTFWHVSDGKISAIWTKGTVIR